MADKIGYRDGYPNWWFELTVKERKGVSWADGEPHRGAREERILKKRRKERRDRAKAKKAREARTNPEGEEGNNTPLIIGAVVVVGIILFMMMRRPRRPGMMPAGMPGCAPGTPGCPAPGMLPPCPPGSPPGMPGCAPQQQQPTGVAAGIASILNPLAKAGAQMYGAHTQAQIQQAQMRQARGY